jgi:hypothetical protein
MNQEPFLVGVDLKSKSTAADLLDCIAGFPLFVDGLRANGAGDECTTALVADLNANERDEDLRLLGGLAPVGTNIFVFDEFRLRAQRNRCLDPNRIQNFLEPRNRDCLIVALLIPTNHLLAHAQSPRQFGLRNAFGNPDPRDEGCDLTEPLDLRQIQHAGLQLIVLAQLIFKLSDHAFVAPADRGGAFARLLLIRLRECSAEAFDLSKCPVSLRVALDHGRAAFTT